MSTSPSPQTIVAWVYPSATNGVGRSVVSVGGANQHYNILGLSTGLGRWYCASRAAGSENYVASLTPPALNQWTHLAATFASSTSRVIWVNGVAEGTNTTWTVPTLTHIGIGVRADGAFPNATAPSWYDGDCSGWRSTPRTFQVRSPNSRAAAIHVWRCRRCECGLIGLCCFSRPPFQVFPRSTSLVDPPRRS